MFWRNCLKKIIVELYPYQIEGAKWLATRRVALLADEMGIGKTAQSIRAAELTGAKDILVICRAVAIQNWKQEFLKFSLRGPTEYNLTVTSYESLHHVDSTKRFDVLIVDESHYLKEPNANRTRDVLGKTGAIHRAGKTWLLTGTPTPNHAGEFWTTLYTFGHTRLGYDEFVERYCRTRHTGYGRQILGTNTQPDKIAEIRGMLGPICLRRTKEDVNLNLPPITYGDITVNPGHVELIMCKSFAKYVCPVDRSGDLIKDLEREMGVVNGIVKGKFTDAAMKALEANAKSIMTLRRYNSMQKVEPVVELISQELKDNAYQKIVIFAIHRDTIVNLQDKLSKFGAVLVFGGSKPSRMEDRIKKFQTEKRTRVFIAQLHTAGTSLTLTAADQVMFVDLDWVPGNNLQAAARCHRIGQTRPVTVRSVMLANSIDQHISSILSRKTAELAQLMDGVKEKKSLPESKNKNITELL